jgi:ribonucleoside-diphosphate reductase alpha chain
MKPTKWLAPVLDGNEMNNFKYPYTHGFFCGDGTYSDGCSVLSLYADKKELINKLDICTMLGQEDTVGRINMTLPLDIEAKFCVPHGSSIACRVQWLAGWIV